MDTDAVGSQAESNEDSDAEQEIHSLSQQTSAAGQTRPIWMRHPFLVVFGLCFFLYMIIVPTIGMIIDSFTPVASGKLEDMTLLESIRLRSVSGIVTLMFLAAGASIGSFLNVVIYRLPRSLPLFWPPSACTQCKTRLSGMDNIPIIAWLKLGGRCRYCQTSISARYPVIESIVGLVFVVFFFRELLSGGASLPVRTPNFYHGIVWILLYTKWDLVTLYFFHMLLLVILLGWGMINYDRFRVPIFPAVGCLLTFVTLASIFPHLNPTSKNWEGTFEPMPASLACSLAGCLTGLAVGLALNGLFRTRDFPPDSNAVETIQPSIDADQPEAVEPDATDTSSALSTNDQNLVNDQDQDHRAISTGSSYGSISSAPRASTNLAACLAMVGATLGVEAALTVAVLTTSFVFLARSLQAVRAKGTRRFRPLPATIFTFVSATLLLYSWISIYGQFRKLYIWFN